MSMQLLQENLSGWLTLAMNGAALLIFVTAAVLGFWRLHLSNKGASAQELEKLDKARNTLERLLQGSVFGLVTKAEQDFGAGMGEIKKSAVLTELLKLVPEQWRDMFDEEALTVIIENGLTAAKEIWEKVQAEDAAA